MTSLSRRIGDNLAHVRARIAEAARRSGRAPDDITLVAVTKYASLDAVRELLAAGCRDLGESRPQQLWERAATLAVDFPPSGPDPLRWHLIGHLQRNKVRRTAPHVALLHSADSQRLVEACGAEATALGLTLPVLLETNISGDAAKHGFRPDELPALIESLAMIAGVQIRGLMAMSGLDSDAPETRRQFAAVRQLRDDLQTRCPPHVRLDELSLGMSGDYEIAIEEGATLVRVGSALFEGLES